MKVKSLVIALGLVAAPAVFANGTAPAAAPTDAPAAAPAAYTTRKPASNGWSA